MFKIWVKLFKENKIIKNFIYEKDKTFRQTDFDEYLREICGGIDIPTPVILKSHRQHFVKFNRTKFSAGDFIESIDFDELVLENVIVREDTKIFSGGHGK